ncbi:MAG: dTDP-4-dehydrorhamnose 3,5-epimerase family protein [Thermoplasmata archaeon]|nr:dTDP-4-dehydrorhamnose 3,5-epimerase family protein [Thermoplasmata archaeon]
MTDQPRLATIEPFDSHLHDVIVLPRTVHFDPRGFLIETLRSDDASVAGDRFAMSYTSVTVPGERRDIDRWHVHHHQEDRFVVPLGEMILALYDPRPLSPTRGRIEAIRMAGAPVHQPASPAGKRDLATAMVTIPREVYHCIGNLHREEPFLLQNYPTALYNAADEGRVPFVDSPISSLGGRPFSWDLVEVVRP